MSYKLWLATAPQPAEATGSNDNVAIESLLTSVYDWGILIYLTLKPSHNLEHPGPFWPSG